MANTGLKDIMKAAFGGVPSMLSGEKFLQNARAFRIVVEELISCTVKNASSADDNVVGGMPNKACSTHDDIYTG